MKFNNVQNKAYNTEDGIIYHSRSVAIVGYIVAFYKDEPYFLIGQRSENMDNANKLNMPCGYLDWNETLHDAFIREIFEETGLDITLKSGDTYYIHTEEPFKVTSNLKAKQNVTLHFAHVFKTNTLPDIKPDFESNWVRWIPYAELMETDKDTFAFNHFNRINEFYNEHLHLLTLNY